MSSKTLRGANVRCKRKTPMLWLWQTGNVVNDSWVQLYITCCCWNQTIAEEALGGALEDLAYLKCPHIKSYCQRTCAPYSFHWNITFPPPHCSSIPVKTFQQFNILVSSHLKKKKKFPSKYVTQSLQEHNRTGKKKNRTLEYKLAAKLFWCYL